MRKFIELRGSFKEYKKVRATNVYMKYDYDISFECYEFGLICVFNKGRKGIDIWN